MYALLISLATACGVTAAFGCTGTANWIWSPVWGLLAFFASQAAVGLVFRKRIAADTAAVQEVMQEGQRALKRLTDSWRVRPPSGMKQAQEELFRLQKKIVAEALEASRALDRYLGWVPMMKRQTATLRLQLHWMAKDFKNVDLCLKDALLLDPTICAIKLARGYMTDPEADPKPAFDKAVRRVPYGKSALLFALYSWILVKQGKTDAAYKALLLGCEKNEHAVLKTNRDHLANNRFAHFSNAGFGDEWYALQLEEPKVKMQRRPGGFGRPF